MPTQNSSRKRLIAVCGKGGTGKTAITAMMTRVLLGSGSGSRPRILLIDADPASCLPGAVGVAPRRTVGEVRAEVIKAARSARDQGKKDQLARTLDYMVLDALVESDGFSLLAMGHQQEKGCFCPVNRLLRSAIETLSQSFDVTIIDGEAGIEQVNRQVMTSVDTMLLIADPTARGINIACSIGRMVLKDKSVTGPEVGLIVNKVNENEAAARELAGASGLEVLGFIPENKTVSRFDLEGKPLLQLPESNPSVAAVAGVVRRLGLLGQSRP